MKTCNAGSRPHSGMKTAGLTLIESLVAMAVLAVFVATAVTFLSTVGRSAALTEHAVAASELAQQKIEQLLRSPYGDLASGADRLGVYDRAWTVSHAGRTARIDVAVSWAALDARREEVALRTLRTR